MKKEERVLPIHLNENKYRRMRSRVRNSLFKLRDEDVMVLVGLRLLRVNTAYVFGRAVASLDFTNKFHFIFLN